jgi:cytochrome P450
MMQKVQNELGAATPGLSTPIKYSEAIKLPYLCAVIREAMRLFNGVGLGLPRISPPGGIKLSGMRIQQGYRIGISNQVVTYDESTFGSDASEFRPERWLVSEESVRTLERGTALQFGAGTRTCTGKNVIIDGSTSKLTTDVHIDCSR